jgi:hypothetical protein
LLLLLLSSLIVDPRLDLEFCELLLFKLSLLDKLELLHADDSGVDGCVDISEDESDLSSFELQKSKKLESNDSVDK